MRITGMLKGLAAVVLVSGSLVLTGGPTGALTAHAAGHRAPQTGPPIPAPAPPDAPRPTRNDTPTYAYNWSGYAQKVGSATGPYTAVRDYWTVPAVDAGLPGRQYSSDWVGIGEGNSAGGDLVQDGTEADSIDGKVKYDAWTEILPAVEVVIPGLTIKPGDRIEGLVEETGKNVWAMTVYDLTTGKSGGRTVTYNASDGGPASQTSAEAIHERTHHLATLAQTTDVTFDPGFYSTATYTPKWKPLLTAAPGATLDRIFMQNKSGATIASPSVPSADKEGFTVADGAAAPPAPWGTAEQVPGLAALNTGGDAQITSVSCASGGGCGAGGSYQDSSGNFQAFVVSEADGTWGTAEKVPGLAALATGGFSEIDWVSCPSAGNCSAAGGFRNSSPSGQPFVVSELDGSWGTAEKVPGLAALDAGGNAQITSVSCGAAGNCSAGGYYVDSSGNQAFVVSQVDGSWGTAEEVPGTAALNTGGSAEITSVSCAAAGNCSASGDYQEHIGSNSLPQAFVVSEVDGSWGTAEEVPGLAALNRGGDAMTASVSCATAGNCSAGGYYTDRSGVPQAFVVSQAGGTWGTAEEIPGTAALNADGNAAIYSVSCGAAGNCSVGRSYLDGSGDSQAFVVSQVDGTWGTAEEVPGTAALNTGGNAAIVSVSCATAGDCSAGGYYLDGLGDYQAFVAGEPST
jgi:Peptidase A4 family